MTDTERALWSLLRDRRLMGFKFRRQFPIGSYVVDFCSYKNRLVIELDGGGHLEKLEYDQRRTDYLESKGYRVLRFWNNDLLKEREAVCCVILAELNKPGEEK
jgi:very-short-patch-repair endonuclease